MAEFPELSDEEWVELVERLTLYADSKIRKLTWRGVAYSKGGSVPGGVCPADMASEAITDWLDGNRNWNREKQTNLLRFLMDVIDSKVNHLAQTIENRKTRRIVTPGTGRKAYAKKTTALNPDCIVAEEEVKDRFRKAVCEEIGEDGVAAAIFECLEADITKPSEIAELLGMEVTDVNNAQKRLRRGADKACKKLGRTTA